MKKIVYETRITRLTVLAVDQRLYHESATSVELEDEAAGEFVVVTQTLGDGGIRIDPDEWPQLCDAIHRMVESCRSVEDGE
jgi:hypothetical protein